MTVPLVLIVEDDAKLAEIFSLTLQTVGFGSEWIADGAAALTRLAKVVPDLILLDLHLPKVDGLTVLRQIRADERLAKTRIILATADEQLAQTIEDQADLVLLKPISPEQLSRLVSRLTQ